jgi:hypothetical protein
MKRGKRTLSKGKIYGFNPWTDQVHAIDRIMEESGEKSESTILRDLIDEGLAGRRRKSVKLESAEPLKMESETLKTVQALLLKLVRQGETSLRVQDVSLALLQDTLAEAHAVRKISWDELREPSLRKKGATASQIKKQFDSELAAAKHHALRLATEIKKSQDRPK